MINDSRNVLVLGSSGMLGSVVGSYLNKYHNVYQYDSKGFNILEQPISDLDGVLLNQVDFIINCAGIIKPRIKNHTVEEVLKVNSLFPAQLSKYEPEMGEDDYFEPELIQISTDCVFSGKTGQYAEDAQQDATDLYGISKALAEEGTRTQSCVLRTSIIGEEINNKYSLLEWAKSQEGKKVKGFSNHLWNGVTTLELAKIINILITEDCVGGGLYNIHSDVLTKYELLLRINEVYDLNLKIEEVEAPEAIDRTLVRSNDNSYTHEKSTVKKSILEQLEELKEFFSNGNVR